jgi:hypothetical protein
MIGYLPEGRNARSQDKADEMEVMQKSALFGLILSESLTHCSVLMHILAGQGRSLLCSEHAGFGRCPPTVPCMAISQISPFGTPPLDHTGRPINLYSPSFN